MRRRITAVLVLVLAIGFTVTAFRFHTAYGTFAFWGPPGRITWCGRDYLRSELAPRTRARIEAEPVALPGDAPYPVVQVGTAPSIGGRPLLAAVTPPARREPAGLPCAMVLHLEVGADRYDSYELSGGP
jgi:hypothetical protein